MPNIAGPTRREALRKMLLVSVGIGSTLVGASAIMEISSRVRSRSNSKQTQTKIQGVQSQTVSSPIITQSSTSIAPEPSNYTIKVAYFGFLTEQITGTSEDYLTLPTPVHLQDVLTRIGQEHPVLTTMLPTMSVVVNGIAESGNPQLTNDTEVDLVPTFAGG